MAKRRVSPTDIQKTLDEIETRNFEESVYAQVAEELERGELRPGLWAMALAKATGDEDLAKAMYIDLRAHAILDEQVAEVAQKELGAQAKAKRENLRERTTVDGTDVVRLAQHIFARVDIGADTRETLEGILEDFENDRVWEQDVNFVVALAQRLKVQLPE